MQYGKPTAENAFAGDMMPYWDGDQFHLFYLLDHDHHAQQGGLGGHQWAHASTTDLKEWRHYPLAVPIGAPGSVDQHGICTGSIFEHDGLYHAFYATRIKNADGSVFEAVCRAVSRDLIHFEKSPANPMFPAPQGYDPGNHRDPFVFRHPGTETFHMLVTASRDGRGVLAHYTSDDLDHWELQDPFLIGRDHHSPECPELFQWNGWWYLIVSHDAQLEYRMARDPLGPWQNAPYRTIEGSTLRVPRTAEFRGGRRLAAGFLPWRAHARDAEGYVYAGSIVFRELIQAPDGALETRFAPELQPQAGPAVSPPEGVVSLTGNAETRAKWVAEAPDDCVVRCRIVPGPDTKSFGLLLRADERLQTGYLLRFDPREQRVTLRAWPDGAGRLQARIEGMGSPAEGVDLEIYMQGSIIDVCVNDRRTLVERCFDRTSGALGLFANAASVRLEGLTVSPLLS